MRFKSGVYEVLSNDEASYIHGNADEIQTTHTKNVWLKDLSNGEVSNVSLENSAVPVRLGARIGLAFFNGEIIAFKRSSHIPVEDPISQRGMHNSFKAALWATVYGLALSIPYLGYITGLVVGAFSLIFGMNLLGRYRKFPGNRIFGAFVLCMSIYVWFPYQSAHGDWNYLASTLTNTATVLTLGFLGFQMYKINVEKEHYHRAVAEINAAWKKIDARGEQTSG
ncbi:hypothetical protein ACIQAL_09350 [Pseudomonas sp. NPDC088368]|uniref:hypothetical protein n=1 Tax=Pseudomonas sp. NPDC088368 TaxID=3364453 RepID=UPI00380E3C96